MKTLVFMMSLLFSSPLYAATIGLNPQPDVALLGVSCGGIHTSTFVTGFNQAGAITGEVYAWTRCEGPRRVGSDRSQLYFSWHSIVWDLNGTPLATLPYDGMTPNPNFTARDGNGDTIYTVAVPGGRLGMLETPS